MKSQLPWFAPIIIFIGYYFFVTHAHTKFVYKLDIAIVKQYQVKNV